MKRIFAWQTDTAGCFMYRIYWPLSRLDKSKFEVAWGAPGPDIHDYDIVIGQRIAGDNGLWRELCRNPNIFTVYDLDDDLLNVDPENSVPYSIYHPVRDHTQINIDMADAVTVSTSNLADMFGLSVGIHVLPNCLPQSYFDPHDPIVWPPVLGWGGSMFHRQDWPGIKEQLRIVMANIPGLSFHTVGADYIDGAFPHRSTPWSTVDNYLRSLDFTLGIAPLVPTKFNQSKSHVKLLEYASRGIPAVATNWGQYSEYIQDGYNGWLIKEPLQWSVTLLDLLTDPDGLKQLSGNAYQYALNFTTERNIHLWESVYARA